MSYGDRAPPTGHIKDFNLPAVFELTWGRGRAYAEEEELHVGRNSSFRDCTTGYQHTKS